MMTDVASFRASGAISAPATAFKENGDLDTAAVKSYVDFLVANQVDGVFILGTIGEGMSLTTDERKQAAAAWVEHGKNRLSSIVVQVGSNNIRDTVELAKHAESIKASAIACMAPCYNKPDNEDSLVEYLAEVAASAPSTPFYYYCINFMTGVQLNTARVLELASQRIPTLRGLKMSSRELPDLLDCTQVCGGKLDIMVGTDEQFLTALSLNVRVPVLNGYLGPLFKRLQAAFDKSEMDTARREQAMARKIVLLRSKYGGGPALTKAIMKCLGLDLGPVRLPLKSIPDSRLDEMRKDLKDCGLLSS